MRGNPEPKGDINSILLEAGRDTHSLHLYSHGVDKHPLQGPALASKGGETVYVTLDRPEAVMNEFDWLENDLRVVKPSQLEEVSEVRKELRIVVDGGSIPGGNPRTPGEERSKLSDHLTRESYLSENFPNSSISCFYDLGLLDQDILEELVSVHDKLMLTRNDTTLLASEKWDGKDISSETVQRAVKSELRTIVLALLLREPMHGTEIINKIHERFGVLLSPGTIYPLLHQLEDDDLLKCEYGTKTKTYKPKKGSEGKIRDIIDERVKVSSLLSQFLQPPTEEVKG